jgi:ribose transport system substrate-binding protein
MRHFLKCTTALAALAMSTQLAMAGPETVSGPGVNPECFAPWSADTKFFQWEAKEGPYRVAMVNGFVGNTWRIQMIKTAKAYAEDPAIKDKISELKVVSTGTDAPAQLGAIEDFINQGYDAIVTIAVSPDGFDRVIRLADRSNVVLVPFDNVLDTDKVMQVNEDQLKMGRMWAEFALEELKAKGVTSGKILEVRGLPGNSVDRDRSIGINEVFEADGGNWEMVSVVGNWDDGTAQKVVADAIAVHGQFDAVVGQGGSTGVVQALLGCRSSHGAGRRRIRERLPQAIAQYSRRGPEGHLDRPVAGSRGDLP